MKMPLISIYDVRAMAWPTDYDALFGRKAPLIVEIGFGRANHLIHLAKLHPECNVLGIEISQPALKKAVRKAELAGLTNVRVVCGSAPLVLQATLTEPCISELRINFPDPWPKENHHVRRLINPDFLVLAASRMLPGAELNIATDHADYQPVVVAALTTTDFFVSRFESVYSLEDEGRFQTKYELKALAEGRIPHYYKWQRNETPVTARFAPPEEAEMPHVILYAPLTLDDICDRFEPQHYQSAETDLHVRLTSLFRNVKQDALLVETFIKQEPYSQRVALRVLQRGPNELLIGLHNIGFPRSNAGIHFAAQCLTDWLQTLDPDIRVEQSNLNVS